MVSEPLIRYLNVLVDALLLAFKPKTGDILYCTLTNNKSFNLNKIK